MDFFLRMGCCACVLGGFFVIWVWKGGCVGWVFWGICFWVFELGLGLLIV